MHSPGKKLLTHSNVSMESKECVLLDVKFNLCLVYRLSNKQCKKFHYLYINRTLDIFSCTVSVDVIDKKL